MKISMRLHVPLPRINADYDPTGIAGPLAAPHQWQPDPNMPKDRSAFAVAVARKFKNLPGANMFIATTRDSYVDFSYLVNYYAGQYDGFYYEYQGKTYVDNPSLFPIHPSVGVKAGPPRVGGDSSGPFAGYLWLERPASIALNSYVGQAKFAKRAFAYTHEYAKDDMPLESYFLDWSEQLQELNSSVIPDWLNRADVVLPAFNALDCRIIVKVPAFQVVTSAVIAFVNKVQEHIFDKVTWTASYAIGDPSRDAFAAICQDYSDYIPVSPFGVLRHADGAPEEPALMPNDFVTQVIGSPEFELRNIIIESGGDSLIVLNNFLG